MPIYTVPDIHGRPEGLSIICGSIRERPGKAFMGETLVVNSNMRQVGPVPSSNWKPVLR